MTLDLLRRIVAGTPPYVWLILALLLAIGVRRLKPRRTPLAVAAAAPIGFTAWTSATIAGTLAAGDGGTVVAITLAAAAVGFLSGPFRLVARPVHLGGGIFAFPATYVPLVCYMLIFWTRYPLEVLAHVRPWQAATFASVGSALSALTAGRTIADFLPLARTVYRDTHGSK